MQTRLRIQVSALIRQICWTISWEITSLSQHCFARQFDRTCRHARGREEVTQANSSADSWQLRRREGGEGGGGGGMGEGREGRCIADGASSEDHVQALLSWPICSDPVFWSAALPSFCHSLPKV